METRKHGSCKFAMHKGPLSAPCRGRFVSDLAWPVSFCDAIPHPNGLRYPEFAFSWRIKMGVNRGSDEGVQDATRSSTDSLSQGFKGLDQVRRIQFKRIVTLCGGLNGFEKKKNWSGLGGSWPQMATTRDGLEDAHSLASFRSFPFQTTSQDCRILISPHLGYSLSDK